MIGSTVKIEIAEKVNCITCGKECYAMTPAYICHNCWKDGSAAMHISQLQSMHNGRLEEISALQNRLENADQSVWKLVSDISGFENAETELVNALQALVDYHESDYEVLPEVAQARAVIAKIKGLETA